MFPRVFFCCCCCSFFSKPRSMTEPFLSMALAGAICRRRTVRLHLKYTSQRPCWFLVILCCMIYMILLWMLFFFFFLQEGDLYVQFVFCVINERFKPSWRLMWNILGEKASSIVRKRKPVHVPCWIAIQQTCVGLKEKYLLDKSPDFGRRRLSAHFLKFPSST